MMNCVWIVHSSGMGSKEAFENVQQGYRMPCPDKCPSEIYDVILSCWSTNPPSRPSFDFLNTFLHDRQSPSWQLVLICFSVATTDLSDLCLHYTVLGMFFLNYSTVVILKLWSVSGVCRKGAGVYFWRLTDGNEWNCEYLCLCFERWTLWGKGKWERVDYSVIQVTELCSWGGKLKYIIVLLVHKELWCTEDVVICH